MPTLEAQAARRRLWRSLVGIALALIIVGPLASYVGSVSNARGQVVLSRAGCLRSTADRWSDVLDARSDEVQDRLRASLTHGLEAASFIASAERAAKSADERITSTAPTLAGRTQFCARVYPLPSLLPGLL